jgi:hypothetical protein
MEPETIQTTSASEKSTSAWNTVTPFSKYLAMALFVALPFIGGWVGYVNAPEKLVEVENVNVQNVVQEENSLQKIHKSDFHYIPGVDPSKSAQLLDDYIARIYGGRLIRYKWGKDDKEYEVFDIEILADFEIATSSWTYGDYSYDKGRVLDFWVSPNKEYIAYLIQTDLGGCCGTGISDAGSVDRLMVMRADGSSKTMVDRVPRGKTQISYSPDINFNGWMWNSRHFVFYERYFDESTSGTGFYVGTIGTSTITAFAPLTTGNDYAQNVVRAEPYFSPTEDLMVYIPDGIDGDTVVLSRTDGSEAKELLNYKRGFYSLRWSDDGNEVYIRMDDKEYTFNKEGQRVID